MFTVEAEIPWNVLEQQVRETTLLNQPGMKPYADSEIAHVAIPSQRFDNEPRDFFGEHTLGIRPTSKYVLQSNLEFQEQLREDLQQQIGHDQLQLMGGLVLRNSETEERSVLAPPIIEQTRGMGHYILDGMHRIWGDRARRLANQIVDSVVDTMQMTVFPESGDYSYGRKEVTRHEERLVWAIVVHDPAFPAYARTNRWEEVKVVDEVPTNPADKKNYRMDYPGGYKALYRDFSHIGSSGLRGV